MSRNVFVDLSLAQTPERINANINSHFHPSIDRHDDIDDDVIFVPHNVNDVIDLCTPEPSNYASTRIAPLSRRHTNVNQLANRRSSNRLISRRRLPISDSRNSLQSTAKDVNSELSNATFMVEDNTLPEANILMCPICMESPVQREPTTTSCGHIFCKTCLEQSLKINPKCPTCRTKVNRKRLVRLYIGNILN